MSFFGKNVKKIRGVKKMSQQAFANLFSLKRATLGAYEEGRSEPKIDTIIKVANYFSISIDDILTKEITVNQLLHFNDGITTNVHKIVANGLVEIPLVTTLNKDLFISEFASSQDCNFLPKIKTSTILEGDLLAYVVESLEMVRNQEGLFSGDIVVGKKVVADQLDKNDVVIVLIDGEIFVRRFSKTETSYVFLADQVNVAPIEIALDVEIYFWKVKEVILKRYPKFTNGIEDKINQIMNKLKD